MARERKVRTVNDKAADPAVDFLGERAWKAVARQRAVEVLQYQLEQAKLVSPGGTERARQWVDAILGTIGPFYEAAIRDAVLRFIDVMEIDTFADPCGDHDHLAPPAAHPRDSWEDDAPAWIAAFLWRKIDTEFLEERRRAAGH